MDETPGVLPEESLKQIMLDIEASKKKRQTDYRIPESEPCPDGPPPEGYHNPRWSNSEKRWFCQATQGEHRFLIWDKDKASWIEWAKFQEGSLCHPFHLLTSISRADNCWGF